ncbi:carbonic anhydrase 15-like [Agrilus planipennis]|uniref:Carbonic anhydrase 15-like n=1 Tax=Agrilus planipennis TaxID=224129 RepID=A0A1W4WVX4_AGRPL|nr:carbonic anhydrase 15-like [Agrilus planipennis]
MVYNCVFGVIWYFIFLDLTNGQFGYSKDEQARWQEQHRSCGGDLQSPIKIDSLKAIPIRMPALEMIRYHDLLPGPLLLHNNGHSVSLSIAHSPPNQPDVGFIPYVFGARLTNEYELEGLHFHWGDKNNLGSEHTFNDVRFPMEMHMVHRNRRYPTVEEAMNHTDGLAVLAFFFQLRENDNRPLNQLVRYLPHVYAPNASLILNETFTLASILPPTEDLERFYMYRGSLTTPPCSEAVTWILFPNPMPVSVVQVIKNFRSTPRGNREI